MPGMMETVLDIGLSELTLPGFVRVTGNPQLAWDAYRRLVAGFGEVVLGVDRGHFERDLQGLATGRDERELDFAELRQLTRLHLASVLRESGRPFPQDPGEQLRAAIAAVFGSWQADKALAYRRLHGLPDQPGTAVTVQAMVFGNAGGTSGAGVGFTRHPSTGAPAALGRLSVQGAGRGCRLRAPHGAVATPSWPRWRRRSGTNCASTCTGWSRPSATCRTSNSRSRRASCGCCRPAMPASARRRRVRASRSTCSTKASSTPRRHC
jgi:hypothetical protein